MSNAPIHKVVPGMTFNASHADGMPLYRVVGPRGNGVWNCVVDESSLEYAGEKRVFDEAEILQRVASRDGLIRSITSSDEWWESLELGSIIHYKDGFDKFVRCRIIQAEGKKKALPIALVGNWASHDLPFVTAWGEVAESYNVKQVRTQAVFQPHYSHIYEATDEYRRGMIDPRRLPELDLTVPNLTPEQERAKYLNDLRQELAVKLSMRPSNTDFVEHITAMLREAKDIINAASL